MNSSKSKTQSKSSTQTTNKTETLNSALSGDVEKGVGVSGQNNTIHQTVTDGGAFDLVGQTIDGVGGVITALLENQTEVMGSATKLAESSVMNMAASTGVEAVEAVKPMTEKTKLTLGVSAAIAALGIAWAAKK